MARALLFIALLSLAAAPRAAVFDPDLHWFSLASEHFIVHYHEGEGTLAHQTLAIAEGVHRRLSQEFRWTPRGRTEIVLSDQADLANGYATPLPANRIVLFATSPRDVMDHSTWFELLITHEYAHILHLDKAEGFPRWFRKVFGRFLLFFPNLLQPAWYVEGLATYYETDPQRGLGRGQSTAFDMLMRMEVAAGVKPLKQINQRVASWPAGQVPYLYGVSFYQFLAERHGGRRIRQWVDEYSDNIIPFRLSANARRVTRRTSAQLYDEFEQYLVEKYRPQLAAIRAAGVVSGKPLSHHGYATALPRVAADGTVYYIRADGRRRARLMALAPGAPQSRPLTKVTVVAALDSHPEQGLLLSQLELCRATRWYFDLYRVNPANGHRRRLTHCGRYRAAAWSPSGHRIAAVANGLGNNRLVLLDQEGQELDTLWQGTAGEIVLGLDWAPNGDELVAAVWREQGGWNLEAFSLRERRWHPLTADSALERDPRYSADGRSVLFSADYGGVYNLRRLDRASGAITTLSNVEGGAFAPSQGTAGGPIYYAGYHADGYNLYRLDAPLAQPPRPLAGPTALAGSAPASPTTDEVRPYAPWRGLLPRWWLPHLVAEHDDRYEIGLITSGWDALQRHSYALTAAYDIEQDLALGALDYVYNRWRPALRLHASRWNDFYRQGKTLRRIRHADTLEAELGYPWLRFDHRWSAHLGLIQERKSDAWTAPGVGALADTEDNVLGLALSYDSTHFPPLAISRAEGRNITLV
ncbi:MAG TPA: hypothetical protein ENJ19_00730, partial [Gammaproteobacteria bacterium]|nr:hypothetical protein [Gammaproteobacteria bacterium]